MDTVFVTFRKHNDINEIKQLEALLAENGIGSVVKDVSSSLDNSLSGSFREYELQVAQQDFDKASDVLREVADDMLDNVPADYYLYDFTNDELKEVLAHQDEWGEFDYLLARKLLSEKGVAIDEEQLKTMHSERIAELSKPEPSQKGWIIAGYIMALLGGLGGIFTGYVIWSAKKTLPNGIIINSYNDTDREQGKIVMIIGMIMLPTWIIVRFFLWTD